MKIHIVQQGDTLWKIAKKYNVDFEQLKSINTHLSDPDLIMPGMKIKIPTESFHVKKQKKEIPVKKEEVVAPAPPPPKKPFPKKKKEMVSPAYEFEPMPEEKIPMPPKGAKMMKYYPMMPKPMAMPYTYPTAMPGYYPDYPMVAGMKGKENPNITIPNVMGEMNEESSSFLPNIPNKKVGVAPYVKMNEPLYQMPMMNPMPQYGVHPMQMGAPYYPDYAYQGWMPNYYDPNVLQTMMPNYYDPNVLYQTMPMPNPVYGYQAPPFPDHYGSLPGYRDEGEEDEFENYRDSENNEEANEDEPF